MADEVIPQPLNGEISIDDTHQTTDQEEQQHDLDTVIDEEVDGTAPCCSAV